MKKVEKKTKSVTFRIGDELQDDATKLAEENGMDLSSLIRFLLVQAVKKQKIKIT